jgi:hypothetical protein
MKLFKFQTELVRTKDSLERANNSWYDAHYQNDRIEFDNGYQLSIQCSSGMYCSPRISQPDPTLYTQYEVGVLYVGGEVDLTNLFQSLGLHQEDTWLVGYVPSDKVQMIYDYVKKINTPEARIKKIKNIIESDTI